MSSTLLLLHLIIDATKKPYSSTHNDTMRFKEHTYLSVVYIALANEIPI